MVMVVITFKREIKAYTNGNKMVVNGSFCTFRFFLFFWLFSLQTLYSSAFSGLFLFIVICIFLFMPYT
ncbi:hypothetical protein CYV15_09740 [Riemerella anatipestifer]|nr:hypothetical protein CYV15_09740 [Riemerella anatipestifer]